MTSLPLPPPLELSATEAEAVAYAAALAEACARILHKPVTVPRADPATAARVWLLSLRRAIEDDPTARAMTLKSRPCARRVSPSATPSDLGFSHP